MWRRFETVMSTEYAPTDPLPLTRKLPLRTRALSVTFPRLRRRTTLPFLAVVLQVIDQPAPLRPDTLQAEIFAVRTAAALPANPLSGSSTTLKRCTRATGLHFRTNFPARSALSRSTVLHGAPSAVRASSCTWDPARDGSTVRPLMGTPIRPVTRDGSAAR